jgi:hypothetical protein
LTASGATPGTKKVTGFGHFLRPLVTLVCLVLLLLLTQPIKMA